MIPTYLTRAAMPALLTLLAGSTPAPAHAPVQEDAEALRGPDRNAFGGISPAELELRVYEPQNVHADEIYDYARRYLARQVTVADGEDARDFASVGLVGRRIVVFDEPHRVEALVERLRVLDMPAEAPRAEQVMQEYAPRFVSLSTAEESLEPFWRQDESHAIGTSERRNAVVLRGTPERVAEMIAHLERIDQPVPQATLSCYVAGLADEPDGRLPRELAENLRAILPGQEFALLGMAVLRTSAAPRREVDLAIDTDGGPSYRLRLRTTAYDPETGALSLERCIFDGPHGNVFSTSAAFRAGEYTVLAAMGSDPVFLVVHLMPVR